MPVLQPLRGVIFDMDGVLCDSEPYIREAATRMLARDYHIEVNQEDFVPFIGAGDDRFIGGPAQKYGVSVSMPRDKLRTYEIYFELIRGRLQPLRGVIAFIDSCLLRRLKLAIATSTDRIKMEGSLREIGLAPERFEAIVTGNDVQRKKPDPQIFELAAARLGLEPPACLVIEDATNGVKAGKAAGCRCLGITSSFDANALRAAGADFTAPDLADVSIAALQGEC